MSRCLAFVLLLLAVRAEAHKPSDSYLHLWPSLHAVDGQWDISLRDLEHALGVDSDGDGAITWGELRSHHAVIADYALGRLKVRSTGIACEVRPSGEQLVDRHSDGAYTVLRFRVECPNDIERLEVQYSLLFDVDPQHRGLLQVSDAAGTRTRIFAVDRQTQTLAIGKFSVWQTLREFWIDGVRHIWLGFDHILFLLALLMPAVLRREADGWQAVGSFGDAFGGTLRVVTAFTVAHSLTLALATLGVVHLPSRLVESGIAASVILAALNNAFPVFRDGRWVMGFAFGLLHGFGFASVLSDPGLSGGPLALALFGFNLGVESGQLVIVALFLPCAFLLRQSWFYQRLTLTAGSLAIAVLAFVWLLERSLNLQLFWS